MRPLLYTFLLCLCFTVAEAQVKVEEDIESYSHTLRFIINEHICLEENYIVIDDELVPHGVWKLYDNKRKYVYTIRYYNKGVLMRKFRTVEVENKR